MKQLLIVFLTPLICFVSTCVFGEPSIPGSYSTKSLPPLSANALPEGGKIVQGIEPASLKPIADNHLEIIQNQKKATIEWDSFNIGENATTQFIQRNIEGIPQTNWSVLNRIHDTNPSRIFGQLKADGKVYLINQRGILFGPNARVNVHSLVASSLDITNDDFLEGRLKFKTDLGSDSVVANHGHIEAMSGGSVFLFAPSVENSGRIDATLGQIGLAAGTEVEILNPFEIEANPSRTAKFANVTESPGEAVNFENGELISDLGWVGMYGEIVKQEGLIRSVTAVKRNGNIELLATEKVYTGKESLTACPISDSPEEVHQSFMPQESNITIKGLNPENLSKSETGVNNIEHLGVIEAPGGNVDFTAKKRIYMEEGSKIDVSGEWVKLPAENLVREAQLNSIEMRDDYGQKDGMLLGEHISFDAYTGSSIGDISGALNAEELTAIERFTIGGDISLETRSGDIILRDGALLDFSGGGIQYNEGFIETTKLLSENTIYDISTAPEWYEYDEIIKVKEFIPSHLQGHDAGLLGLKAKTMVLDGRLDGSVTRGEFQTEFSTPKDIFGTLPVVNGIEQPKGGRLIIGSYKSEADPTKRESLIDEIIIQTNTQRLPNDFGPENPLPGRYPTYLSSEMVTNSGLKDLVLYSNIGIMTEEDTRIELAPKGSLFAVTRSIVHKGEIIVPGGNIDLLAEDTKTSLKEYVGQQNPHYVDLPEYLDEGVHLEEGSRLSVAGEKSDYMFPTNLSSLSGGKISIQDQTKFQHGIQIDRGALLDVSGGYGINSNGKISGGDAGVLEFESLKLNLTGYFKGHSLFGQSGGTFSLHTGEIHVIPDHLPQPARNEDEFILTESFLEHTGFTHIKLKSENNMHFENSVHLTPSQMKLAGPPPELYPFYQPGYINDVIDNQDLRYSSVPFEFLGSSSLKCEAGVNVYRTDEPVRNLEANISVDPWAKIETAVGGTIEMSAPKIKIAGILEALSGNIKVSATNQTLTLKNTGQISVAGYNQQNITSLADDIPAGFTPLPGGSVVMEAKEENMGSIIMEPGFSIDATGSKPAPTIIQHADGTFQTLTSAGDAGRITLSFGGYLNPETNSEGTLISYGKLEGIKLLGHGKMDNVAGGTLVIECKNTQHGLNIHPDDMKKFGQKSILYQTGGFDSLILKSSHDIDFSGSLSLALDRSLTIDAPLIKASGSAQIHLSAPWVSLKSGSRLHFDPLSLGEGYIQLSGNWIDITGDLQFTGFREVQLRAKYDMTLSDSFYRFGGRSFGWKGGLNTASDLILQAARIYPTTLSQVKIHSDKKVTILPGEKDPSDVIYSAGGGLAIEAGSIEHLGFLAVPMGSFVMCQTEKEGESFEWADRIYLADGSKITTKGTSSVKNGDLDFSSWRMIDKDSQITDYKDVTVPDNSISLYGSEIIVGEGAEIIADGGGEIFSYQFLPAIEGSKNPLSMKGRYVILPDRSISLPGNAIYLEGTEGVPEGTYSLLPEHFAFIPGAVIVTDLGVSLVSGTSMSSEEGYPVTRGFSAINGTDFKATIPHLYSVRPAEKVLEEGHFITAELIAGDGGAIKIEGDTAILDGIISGKALPGYEGNQITLSGKMVFVGSDFEDIFPEFSFDIDIPKYLHDRLYIDSERLSESGFKDIVLGNLQGDAEEGYQGTSHVIVEEETTLTGKNLTLAATEAITIKQGSTLHASGDPLLDEGAISLKSPTGEIMIEENAIVHPNRILNLECRNLTLEGDVEADDGTLALVGDSIIFADKLPQQQNDGLILTSDKLSDLLDLDPETNTYGFSHIYITGRKELVFTSTLDIGKAPEISETGDYDFEVISLNTPKIIGDQLTEADEISISSGQINIFNSGLPDEHIDLPDKDMPGKGILSLNAEEMAIGHGDLFFDGFNKIELNSERDLTFSGRGSLTASGEEIYVRAARVTGSFYQDRALSNTDEGMDYESADFSVYAPYSDITIEKSGGITGEKKIPGGCLEIMADNIISEGIIDLQSGQITLNAEGSGDKPGISLLNGGQILAMGSHDYTSIEEILGMESIYAPGGNVYLNTEKGQINIAEDTFIDISSGIQGDAGRISLYAPQGEVFLNGEIRGEADGGRGGSFSLDAVKITIDSDYEPGSLNLASLTQKLMDGDFDHSIDIRLRDGDVVLPENYLEGDPFRLEANNFKLVTDSGDIDVYGSIKASGDSSEKGRIELYAGNDLTLHSSKAIVKQSQDGDHIMEEVTGIYAPGGEVILGSAQGDLKMGTFDPDYGTIQSAFIDVSNEKSGGSIILQVSREDIDRMNMDNCQATIKGASQVIVETFEVYDETSGFIDDNNGSIINLNGLKQTASDFMKNAGDIETKMDSLLSLVPLEDDEDYMDIIHIRPGIEIQYNGQLQLSSDWDLSEWRFDGEPGALSIRTNGDLNINKNLIDLASKSNYSWRLNLVAGADLGSADPLAVVKKAGNLIIADGKAVCTSHAAISFASGLDTRIGYLSGYKMSGENKRMYGGTVPYNMASYDNSIRGRVGGSLIMNGGAIQTATGDIDIEIGKDLIMESKMGAIGTIRTIGALPSDFIRDPAILEKTFFWEYTNGGDIELHVGGKIGATDLGLIDKNAWDSENLHHMTDWSENTAWSASYADKMSTQGLATMAGGDMRVFTGRSFYSQIGTFGKGNLTLFSGGDIDGKFLVKEGEGFLSAMGNVGANIHDLTLEAFDSRIYVTAQGNAHFGTVLNPTMARDGFNNEYDWNLTYSSDSAVILKALTGDVIISGLPTNFKTSSILNNRNRILPPTFGVYANRDIHLSNKFVLTPAKNGNLLLTAGRDIDGLYSSEGVLDRSSFLLSDLEPATIFGDHSDENDVNLFASAIYMFNPYLHAKSPVHLGDSIPVIMNAGQDIEDVKLYVSKEAEILALRDIKNIEYIGQNLLPDDETLISAGRDIFFSSSPLIRGGRVETGVEQGGPGSLIVHAGNSIDLGVSKGIQSIGQLYNPALFNPEFGLEKDSLKVISGYDLDVADKMDDFFVYLKEEGERYSNYLNEGERDLAEEILAGIRQEDNFKQIFQPEDSVQENNNGNIYMFDSQINSSGEHGDLFILANWDINVGRTTISSGSNNKKNSGIYTSAGGTINIYAKNDVNVHESRVMTFRGGDICMWSDQGNINAGRGSKTAINTQPPRPVFDEDGQITGVQFEIPAVGSGIRTLTYDPDGLEGPLEEPDAGDLFIFAPEGEIDAGEAGIFGRRITMAANTYSNVQNISFSETSVGVPSIAEGSEGLVAFSGTGSVAETTKLTEEVSVLDSAQKRMAANLEEMAETFSLKWIKVEIVGFEEEDGDQKDKKK